MDQKTQEYRHKEAFCLMWYACTACDHRERIWNSRDGVTPFGMRCPSCGGTTLLHVDWGRDECAPSHKPNPGQRFFRDGTPDEAAVIMTRRIESLKDSYPLTPEQAASLIDGARKASKGDTTDQTEFQKGWPMVDRAPDHG